jgi:DNA repair ATPase RecN
MRATVWAEGSRTRPLRQQRHSLGGELSRIVLALMLMLMLMLLGRRW